MKKAFKKIKKSIKIHRLIKSSAKNLTYYIPCVNISVQCRLFYGYAFYNNNDLVGILSYCEIEELLEYGNKFFNIILYCLCIKYSIENY